MRINMLSCALADILIFIVIRYVTQNNLFKFIFLILF